MKVIKLKNEEQVGHEASQIVIKKIKEKNNIVLGLATGSTPIPLYNNLINSYNQGEVDFTLVKTFNLDEYKGLEPTHSQSYRYFMNDKLFNHINIDLNNTHVPSGINVENPSEYDSLISKNGGVDLQILGLGINGHIGFNEPYTDFESLTSEVKLTESTIKANSRLFANIDEVPKKAISMGLKSIMNAKEIILLATGKNKSEAIKHLVEGEISVEWPCTILQQHSNVIVIVDEEAASQLGNK
ncbi:Glucosamine-6-phosphate deaminase [Mesoplasma florum W37]|uniref:Glucosamine-6-phosphate deaminase n=1 Tax=Mesoplasma florum TaxID=2151 RepID=A0AAD0MNG3_MESFO|nr:glucosamine-6-phosphate deaminase [Mesoplasma florum]AGY41759.1 Glucosamine-6-phosphate deaminase [Mesoplasma florum W37]AVN59960.1 glucosamine-6-phosphate deaminase [Mesoplasma florum]AVN66098.1 Glucosamine-6-phosphate deaminase [Mesoplasma florum]